MLSQIISPAATFALNKIDHKFTCPVFLKRYWCRCSELRFTKMQKEAQAVFDKYTATHMEQSDFVVTYPDGIIDNCVMYIHRPNKVKVAYKDKPLIAINDGKAILFHNTKEDTRRLYDSPPHLLSKEKIYLCDFSYVDVENKSDMLNITLGYKDGYKYIFTFDEDYVLKKYVEIYTDKINESYEFSNTKKNVKFEKDIFKIPYEDIFMKP